MDNLLETHVPRLFAASDVRSGSTKSRATAFGDGAVAVRCLVSRLASVDPDEDTGEHGLCGRAVCSAWVSSLMDIVRAPG